MSSGIEVQTRDGEGECAWCGEYSEHEVIYDYETMWATWMCPVCDSENSIDLYEEV